MNCHALLYFQDRIHLVSEWWEELEPGRYKLVQITCQQKIHLILGKKWGEMRHSGILKAFLVENEIPYTYENEHMPAPQWDDYIVGWMGQIDYQGERVFKKFPGWSADYSSVPWSRDDFFSDLEREIGEGVQFI